jgi:hypothetical protein
VRIKPADRIDRIWLFRMATIRGDADAGSAMSLQHELVIRAAALMPTNIYDLIDVNRPGFAGGSNS